MSLRSEPFKSRVSVSTALELKPHWFPKPDIRGAPLRSAGPPRWRSDVGLGAVTVRGGLLSFRSASRCDRGHRGRVS